MTEEKKCVGCGNYRDRTEFYASSTTDDSLNRYCKQCCKVNRTLEAVRKRDKKSKLSVRQQQRAKNLGVKWHSDITLAGVYKKHHGICALCHKFVPAKTASMDHNLAFKNGGEHTHENVQLSHLLCNLKKGDR